MNKRLPLLILLTVLMAVQSCGFHLRGSGPGSLDIDSVHVRSESADKLAREVTSQLSGFGIATPDVPDNAQYVLILSREVQDRKILTVTADTGKVQEYEVFFSATMTVRNAAGDDLSTNQKIRVKRDLTVDEDAVLGKFEEERTIQAELLQQAAASVLRRLQTVTRQ